MSATHKPVFNPVFVTKLSEQIAVIVKADANAFTAEATKLDDARAEARAKTKAAQAAKEAQATQAAAAGPQSQPDAAAQAAADKAAADKAAAAEGEATQANAKFKALEATTTLTVVLTLPGNVTRYDAAVDLTLTGPPGANISVAPTPLINDDSAYSHLTSAELKDLKLTLDAKKLAEVATIKDATDREAAIQEHLTSVLSTQVAKKHKTDREDTMEAFDDQEADARNLVNYMTKPGEKGQKSARNLISMNWLNQRRTMKRFGVSVGELKTTTVVLDHPLYVASARTRAFNNTILAVCVEARQSNTDDPPDDELNAAAAGASTSPAPPTRAGVPGSYRFKVVTNHLDSYYTRTASGSDAEKLRYTARGLLVSFEHIYTEEQAKGAALGDMTIANSGAKLRKAARTLAFRRTPPGSHNMKAYDYTRHCLTPPHLEKMMDGILYNEALVAGEREAGGWATKEAKFKASIANLRKWHSEALNPTNGMNIEPKMVGHEGKNIGVEGSQHRAEADRVFATTTLRLAVAYGMTAAQTKEVIKSSDPAQMKNVSAALEKAEQAAAAGGGGAAHAASGSGGGGAAAASSSVGGATKAQGHPTDVVRDAYKKQLDRDLAKHSEAAATGAADAGAVGQALGVVRSVRGIRQDERVELGKIIMDENVTYANAVIKAGEMLGTDLSSSNLDDLIRTDDVGKELRAVLTDGNTAAHLTRNHIVALFPEGQDVDEKKVKAVYRAGHAEGRAAALTEEQLDALTTHPDLIAALVHPKSEHLTCAHIEKMVPADTGVVTANTVDAVNIAAKAPGDAPLTAGALTAICMSPEVRTALALDKIATNISIANIEAMARPETGAAVLTALNAAAASDAVGGSISAGALNAICTRADVRHDLANAKIKKNISSENIEAMADKAEGAAIRTALRCAAAASANGGEISADALNAICRTPDVRARLKHPKIHRYISSEHIAAMAGGAGADVRHALAAAAGSTCADAVSAAALSEICNNADVRAALTNPKIARNISSANIEAMAGAQTVADVLAALNAAAGKYSEGKHIPARVLDKICMDPEMRKALGATNLTTAHIEAMTATPGYLTAVNAAINIARAADDNADLSEEILQTLTSRAGENVRQLIIVDPPRLTAANLLAACTTREGAQNAKLMNREDQGLSDYAAIGGARASAQRELAANRSCLSLVRANGGPSDAAVLQEHHRQQQEDLEVL